MDSSTSLASSDRVIRIAGPVVNCYLVKGDHCYLVDTLTPKERRRIDKALAEQGLNPGDLTHILITHYHVDHTGNLADLRHESGALVAAGVEDIPYIQGEKPPQVGSDLNRLGRLLKKVPSLSTSYQKVKSASVDMALKEGDRLDELELDVIALPGHTPGGIGFLNRSGNWALVGDLVSYYFGRIGPATLCASYSLEELEASMRKLAELELDYMYPGHGGVIGPNASRLVSDYVRKKFG
jgi:glyoxylase-like metal-dependent hydrolase (beta-lactamase superfamily II)